MSKCIIIYGPSKIGISSFLSKAPECIFINPGNGLKHLNCKTIKDSTSYGVIMDTLDKMLKMEKSKFPFKYIVIDHLIGLESLIFKHVCEVNKISHVDYFNYGKGHQIAFIMLQDLLAKIEKLADEKDLTIFLVGHSISESYSSLFQENLTQSVLYTTIKPPKESVNDWLKIWSDAMVYVDDYNLVMGGYNIESMSSDRAISIYTEKRPSFEAGNRFGWPFWVNLKWEDFVEDCLSENKEEASE